MVYPPLPRILNLVPPYPRIFLGCPISLLFPPRLCCFLSFEKCPMTPSRIFPLLPTSGLCYPTLFSLSHTKAFGATDNFFFPQVFHRLSSNSSSVAVSPYLTRLRFLGLRVFLELSPHLIARLGLFDPGILKVVLVYIFAACQVLV